MGTGGRIAIVNEHFAEQHFPDEDAVGRRIKLENDEVDTNSPWPTIAGVVPNVHQEDNDPAYFEPVVYVPNDDEPLTLATIIVRSRLTVGAVAAAVRGQVRTIDPDVPVFAAATLDQAFASTFGRVRLVGALFAVFATAGLALATIGLYGVTAHLVVQRLPERVAGCLDRRAETWADESLSPDQGSAWRGAT